MSFLVNPSIRFEKIDPNTFLINDYDVGKWMFDSGISERQLIDWCQQNYQNKNANFVDIGAHIGTWSWLLAPSFKNVYAFEPNRHVYNHMCGNIAIKNLSPKIATFNIGLSNKESVLTYYERSQDGGGNGFTMTEHVNHKHVINSYQLPVKKLDDFNLTNIHFMKIDVEGHEIEVLKGAEETLKNSNYPSFIIECWDNNKENLFRYLDSIGYERINIIGWKDMFIVQKRI